MRRSRVPDEARVARMGRLSRLPVFLALEGRRAIVVGGEPAAAWKAELLSAAGADVDVYAENPPEELIAIAADPPRGAITIHRRAPEPEDFTGAVIAVGTIANDEAAAQFAAAARAAGVQVNVVDKPAFSDFAFGAIVNRSPLVIGISTDGAAPVFGQAVRAKLEAMIPTGFARWADAARRWRPRVRELGLGFRLRRHFWERFTHRATVHPDDQPTEADLEAMIADVGGEYPAAAIGSVMLVGAGPGDPELLTLRAVRALQSADVILIDELVGPEILDFARREAKKMMVGKTGYGPSCRQEEINALMISLAKAGRRVVRLKGGDPLIFGRAGEEIAACRAAGIAIEVVPGITAAQGAAGRLGLPLTHRRHARRLQYVTGHAEGGGLPADIDWRSLADPSVTTIVYMPKRTLRQLAATAIAHGLAPSTPATIVAGATRPDQMTIHGTIADIADRLEAAAPAGPALVLIGHVVGDHAALSPAELEAGIAEAERGQRAR